MAEMSAEDRIRAAIRAIPRGEVAGYGHVARRAGLPGRARLVARVLAHNDDATLPWHRVLRSDGRIAFERGSRGWREQSQRLRAEGVRVTEGRVRIPAAQDSLDAALWGELMGMHDRAPARTPRRAPGKADASRAAVGTGTAAHRARKTKAGRKPSR